MKWILCLLLFFAVPSQNFAQDIYLNEVLKASRDKLYRNLVRTTINGNLSKTLSDSTEENWQNAFGAMELINYRSPWIDHRIRSGMDSIPGRSINFQRAFLELIYTNYPWDFKKPVKELLAQTTDQKIFAMCAEYLLRNGTTAEERSALQEMVSTRLSQDNGNPFLQELLYRIQPDSTNEIASQLHEFFQKNYLPGNVLLLSFQRKNRNYPGLVMVRNAAGIFIKEDDGNYFAVPQLARSITDLPGYLTNGNTPQGIFRMYGFDHSKSIFIGPSANIQLTMPFEASASHFYKDSTLPDSLSDSRLYKKLLPAGLRNYFPLMQAYDAGKAGRTEIIAHGTTIDPSYYKGKEYYPITPTQGCLCTREIWDEGTGRLQESDQLKLANAITKAGGPYGYAIVIEIDDRQAPITINEILPFLKTAEQK